MQLNGLALDLTRTVHWHTGHWQVPHGQLNKGVAFSRTGGLVSEPFAKPLQSLCKAPLLIFTPIWIHLDPFLCFISEVCYETLPRHRALGAVRPAGLITASCMKF